MRTLCLFAMTLAPALLAAQPSAIDTSRSTVTVNVYKSGLFSGLAHDHLIKAPIVSGKLDPSQRIVELSFNSADMKVADTEGSESEHQEIEDTMKSPKVLDAAKFPVIAFRSKSVEPQGPQQYKVTGELKLHGASRDITLPVQLVGAVYKGSVTLKQTDFGITPVKIAGGTIKVKDEIQINFEIVPR